MEPLSVIRNSDYYFKKGLTFPRISSDINARILNEGIIFDVNGPSIFTNQLNYYLAILNSTFAKKILSMIRPTITFQVGDLVRLPIPKKNSQQLDIPVDNIINLAKIDCEEDETTYDFISPSLSSNINQMIAIVTIRHALIKSIEKQIDDDVFTLYGISEGDRAVIETEVDPSPELPTPSREELAIHWIGYSMGIIMGRFSPGIEGALGSAIVEGKHLLKPEIEQALTKLTLQQPLGILTCRSRRSCNPNCPSIEPDTRRNLHE